MSDFEVRQEDDVVPSRAISVTIAAAVVITIASVFVAGRMLAADAPTRAMPSPTAAPRTIDGIHQTPIGAPGRGLELRAAQRTSISGYEWVDREGGVARIPIERAMEIVAEEPNE